MQKKENGEVVNYYYQGTTVYAVTDGMDALNSLHMLKGENNVLASLCCQGESSGKCFFYGKDGRNSTSAIIHDNGSAAQSYRYGVFGETELSGKELFSEFCYTGSVYDSLTGLYYLNARYYEPETRRFITQDSYRGDVKEPYSLNLYAYCANDPVNRRDADGHKPEYITAQGINEVIDGRRMGDIRIGLFGNVGKNGCGVIAVYNVMVAHGYQGSFTDVLSDMALAGIFELTVSGKFGNIIERITAPFRAMWNGIGKAGIEPGVLRSYLRTKFRSVKIKAGWGWNGIAKHSTAIITLFKWSGLAAHYVAGVKKNNGRRFKFYNHSFSDTNYKGGYITMARYERILKKEGCMKLAIIGVSKPRKWVSEIVLPL